MPVINDPMNDRPARRFAPAARFDSIEPREAMQELAAGYKGIIQRLHDGDIPAQIPWDDPRFQTMVLKLIGDMRMYKKDHDDLAVIRSVFGGKT